MKLILNLFLWTSFIPVLGQRIAVLERNCYSSSSPYCDIDSSSYKIFLRELFVKKGSSWWPIRNYVREDTAATIKWNVQYTFVYKNQVQRIKGVRRKKELNCYLSNQLFSVKLNPVIKLNRLPQGLLDGFEHKDITHYKIVSDIPDPISSLEFKNELLPQELRDSVCHKVCNKMKECGFSCNTKTFPYFFCESIGSSLRVLDDSLRLGRIRIFSQNNCFNQSGSSYGGGNLSFIVHGEKKVQLLYTNTELIDYGDYDHDGRTEYIFMASWFNDYAYILFYDNFEKYVSNGWSYH